MTVYGRDPVHDFHRCREFLNFVKDNTTCPHCGRPPDPHHVGHGGVSIKGSDFIIANICRELHDLCTAVGWGEKKVQEMFGLNFQEMAIDNLIRYVLYLKERGK
jgi:hypothetical protein